MASTAERLLNLIMLLQRTPNQSASHLATQLEVSVRTVQRYIGMLEDMGVPVYAERGSLGGYSLVRGYRMPPLVLSPEEAVAVGLGTSLVDNLWGRLFRTAAQSAMTKIENVLPDEQLREIGWARASLITRGMPRPNPGVDEDLLEALYRASRHRQLVEMVYHGAARSEQTRRRVAPYALIYSWGQQYCIGFCHLRGAMRSFRVDRIQSLTVLDSHFEKPADFDPDEYLNASADQRPVARVRLLFAPQWAHLARDYVCCWDELVENDDGSVVAGFDTADLDTARCRVMGFLPKARVLGPPELIDRVRQSARELLEQYDATEPML